MKNGRIAVPSNGEGGLDATRSGHFGHCDVFTFIDVENGEITDISTIGNHELGMGENSVWPGKFSLGPPFTISGFGKNWIPVFEEWKLE